MLNERKVERILALRRSGLGVKTIAKKLGIDPKTVRKYVRMDEHTAPASTAPIPTSPPPESPPSPPNPQPNLYGEVFALLDEGKTPVEIVKKLNLSPESVKELVLKWAELQALQINKKTVLERLDELEGELHRLKKSFVPSVASGLDRNYKCDECGARGFIALRVQCTECGDEFWWGWFPEDENDKD